MMTRCPLCESSNNQLLETLPYNLLLRLYKQRLDLNLDNRDLTAIELRHCQSCDLMFYTPELSGDEKFYEHLQQFKWYYLHEKHEYDVAASHISSSDAVLEIGFGSGAFAKKLQSKSYVGLELSDAAVGMARRQGLEAYKGTIEEHATKHANSYDVVCAFQVLEHISKPKSFIESSLKCLKRGGQLIQSVPSENAFLGREVNNILNMPPHHATRWTDNALHGLASLFNLEIVGIWHDRISDDHVRSYCTTQVQDSLNRFLGRQQRRLDPYLARVPTKIAVRLLSFALEIRMHRSASRPAGHSVTAIYRKP